MNINNQMLHLDVSYNEETLIKHVLNYSILCRSIFKAFLSKRRFFILTKLMNRYFQSEKGTHSGHPQTPSES